MKPFQSTPTIPRVLVALATMIAAGCGAENEENTASEEALKVFDSIAEELETLRACATDPVTGQDVSSFAGFPLPPKNLQAGVYLPKKVDGKRGLCAVDVNGDGIKEDVEVMTSHEYPGASAVYLTWRSNGESWFAWLVQAFGFLRASCEKPTSIEVCTYVKEPHFKPFCQNCSPQWVCAP